MTRRVLPQPFVRSDGTLEDHARVDINDLLSWIPIIGSGSPEGVVEAQQHRFYIDADGAPGAKLYTKTEPYIGTDRKQGWELI